LSRFLLGCFLILLLTQSLYVAVVPSKGGAPISYPMNGPRLDEIVFVYQATPEASVAAIRKGDTDVLSDIARPSDVADLSADPNINITFTPQTHYCYVAFNTRKAPLSDKQLRKAIACLVPRQEISDRLFGGIIVTPMLYETSPAFGKWHNPNVDIYPYDPSKSKEVLSTAGYSWSKDGKLLSRDGQPLGRISFLSPTQEEAPTSYEIARLVVEEMKKIGFDVYQEGVAFDALQTRVMTERNFDMYFLCVSNLGSFPRWLYDYYDSGLDVPDGDNTPGVRDPQLDNLLYKFRFESETEDEAKSAIWQAQAIIADLAARVPVYSRYEIEAYRKGWEGMVQHTGIGYFTSGSFWTYLNLHKSGVERGGSIRVDLGGRVRTLNPLYGTGAYEQKIITLIYDSLLASDPGTGDPVPYLAENWNITAVDTSGKKSQRITFDLVRNASWQDGEPFTSSDVRFSIEYLKKNKIPIFLSTVERIIEVSNPTPYTVEMIMNGTSIFNLIDAGGILIIPEHIWKNVSDWRTFQPDKEPNPFKPELTKMVGTGPFILSEQKPGEFWRLKSNPGYFKRLPFTGPETEEPEQVQSNPPSSQVAVVAIVAIVCLVTIGTILFKRRRMKRANDS
jgi:peptide/nickel transport system substrate-binding protein